VLDAAVTNGGSRRITLLGCEIDGLTLKETIDEVDRLVVSGTPVRHCFINAHMAVMLGRDERLRELVSGCALINVDGQAVVWSSRLLGRPLPERVAGPDLFEALLALAVERDYSVFFLGAREEVVSGMVSRLTQAHPGLRVAGWRNGYWDLAEVDTVVDAVVAAKPDILFVGITSPFKDQWLADNALALGVPFSIGVGGCFDLFAGHVRRAPVWMQRAGLEWFHRFLQEPRRLWRRYLFGNASFALLVGRAWLAQQTSRSR
jgi:N-acetylglucosaminyldiphosphoundecaprenol N-acetyl-beta-D-mannosaminyltransferase